LTDRENQAQIQEAMAQLYLLFANKRATGQCLAAAAKLRPRSKPQRAGKKASEGKDL